MQLVMTLADAVNRYGLVVVVAALADLSYAFSRFHGETHGEGYWQDSGEALHDLRRTLCKLDSRYCHQEEAGKP